MTVWKEASPGRGRGGRRTKFPWVKVGADGTVRRQSSGEPRSGILNLGVSGRQHSTPDSHLALTNPQNASRQGFALLRWHPLKPFPTTWFSSPEAQTLSLWAVTLHASFQNQILPAGVCPSPVPHCPLHLFLSPADPILSPTCPGKPFSPALLHFPLFLSFSPGEQGVGAGQRRGWAAEGRSWLDTRKGWLPRGTVMRGGRTEAEREG